MLVALMNDSRSWFFTFLTRWSRRAEHPAGRAHTCGVETRLRRAPPASSSPPRELGDESARSQGRGSEGTGPPAPAQRAEAPPPAAHSRRRRVPAPSPAPSRSRAGGGLAARAWRGRARAGRLRAFAAGAAPGPERARRCLSRGVASPGGCSRRRPCRRPQLLPGSE